MTEIWKNLARYPGYEISNLGELRHVSGKPVPRKMLSYGYTQIYLESRVETRQQMLHWLLMETFVGPRPEGLYICHINGIPDDNRLENLCYGTLENLCYGTLENLCYGTSKLNGLHRVANGNGSARKTIRSKKIICITANGRRSTKYVYYWGELPVADGYVHRPLVKQIPGMNPGWCE